MSGESSYVKTVMTQVLEEVSTNPQYSPDPMFRALVSAIIDQYKTYRSGADIASELQSLIDNLSEDEHVVTRGC